MTPDWPRFRKAFVEGLPRADFLRRIRKIEQWLEMSPSSALSALQNDKTDTPRDNYQTLDVLRQTAAGARSAVLFALSSQLLAVDPTLNQPLSPATQAKTELQAATSKVFDRLQELSPLVAPGTVTPEVLQKLAAVVTAYLELASQAAPGNAALPDVYYGAGSAALSLAKGCVLLGRNAEASARFKDAAAFFEKAGDREKARECLNGARSLAMQLFMDLDAAAAQQIEALIAPIGDPFAKAESLINLTKVALDAGDVYEALENATAAALELTRLGYPEPGVEPEAGNVSARWISKACETLTGIPLLRRLTQIGSWYFTILNARYADALIRTPAIADRLNDVLTAAQKDVTRLQQEAAAADREQQAEWLKYFPNVPRPAPAPANAHASYEDLLDRQRAIDQALNDIAVECNSRMGKGDPMEDLLARAKQLEIEAATLNIPLYDAKTRLEHAYVLLQLGRGADLLPLAREARTILLAGRPPSLASFSQGFERYYYLQSLSREAMAHIILGDFEASLKTCEDTIRDFETERYRVNSPYRQSAVLNSVVDFYTWAVFCSFKLSRWDNMLEAAELIKARSAIRSRLIPDPPELPESDLAAQFQKVSEQVEEGGASDDLFVRRRQLWDLLSIARAQSGAIRDLPKLSVSAVQSSLAEDEALIGYFWLSPSTLLVTLAARERFHAERILLKQEEAEALTAFTAFVQQLTGSWRKMDTVAARLGAVLLPPFVRDFVAAKRVLIFSPHHSLNLFPFHAARWDDNDFVGTRFAVRYVPNFSSLLLPWEDRAADRILAVGIAQFADPAVQPLANVENDVNAIRGYYEAQGTKVDTLIGNEATRERLESLRADGTLATLRCVHFGTHGLSVFQTPNQPLESRLLLQNGSLDGMDIASLRLNAELAVLSACHSGQRAIAGRDLGELPGDDIFGLQSALFQSGVRSVLGTLWLVETKSSSAITRAFHREYAAGSSPEIALQKAVKDYLADPACTDKSIFYWAPYFLSSLGAHAKKGQ